MRLFSYVGTGSERRIGRDSDWNKSRSGNGTSGSSTKKNAEGKRDGSKLVQTE